MPNATNIYNERNSHLLLMRMQNGMITLENILTISLKYNCFVPRVKFPSSCANQLRTYLHTQWPCVFIAALFVFGKIWKQSWFSSVSEWISKLCYIITVGYYSPLKRNEQPCLKKIWKNIVCPLLNKRSESKKVVYCIIPSILHSEKKKQNKI